MKRSLLVLVLLSSVMFSCQAGLSPQETISPAPAANEPTETAAPSATFTPESTSTPTPNPTEVARATNELRRGYGTLLLLEASAAMVDETAKLVAADEISGMDAFASVFVAAALMQGVSESLDMEPPINELAPAWEEARLARDGLGQIMRDWMDDEISSEEVLADMEPIWDHIQEAQAMAEEVWVEEYDLDRSELRAFREETQQEIREIVRGTVTPAPTPTADGS